MKQIDLGHKEAFGVGFGANQSGRYEVPHELADGICSWNITNVPHDYSGNSEFCRGTFADDSKMAAFRKKKNCRNWVKNRVKNAGPSDVVPHPNFPTSPMQATDGQVAHKWGAFCDGDETLYLNLLDEEDEVSVSIRINFTPAKIGDGYVTYKAGQGGASRFINYYSR